MSLLLLFHVCLSLLLLAPSSLCRVLPKTHQSSEADKKFICSPDNQELTHGIANSSVGHHGVLYVSACVKLDYLSRGGPRHDQVNAINNKDSTDDNTLTVYVTLPPANSTYCAGLFDVDDVVDESSISFDVVIDNSWPVFVGVCRGPLVGLDNNNCRMAYIVSPDNAGHADIKQGSDEDVVEASIRSSSLSSSSGAIVEYDAILDYCTSPGTVGGNQQRSAAKDRVKFSARDVHLVKRVRRDMTERLEEVPASEMATTDGDDQMADEVVDQGRDRSQHQLAAETEWIKRRNQNWRAAVTKLLLAARAKEQNDMKKRKWKDSGMQWIKKSVDVYDGEDDEDEDGTDNDNNNSDERIGASRKYYDDGNKRKWANSDMGWIKRKWGNSGMGWIKRWPSEERKRKWKDSGMQWVKK